jgi:hypothetical protein
MKKTEIITEYFCDLCGRKTEKEDLREFSRHYPADNNSYGRDTFAQVDVCYDCRCVKTIYVLDNLLESKIPKREPLGDLHGSVSGGVLRLSASPEWIAIN